MSTRIKLDWTGPTADGEYIATVKARDHNGEGVFEIHAEPRPNYCDRGRWKVLIDNRGVSPLDWQEGFPRYYFDLDRLKAEMEDWVNAREECR